MSTDPTPNLFPENPTHGTIFEQKNGVIYQYDSSIKGWLKIASDTYQLPVATASTNGIMTASDFNKLNNLLIPPPISSIIGTDCVAPYQKGFINLTGRDKFVSVSGNANIQNIDEFGDSISKELPYKLYDHTYGFNFSLDVKSLIAELEQRGQIIS